MISLLEGTSLAASLALFLVAAALIAVFGVRMTHIARDLADATGLGQAFMGAVFIGATTSLSGIFASATAAWNGEAGLAVSNSLGGIAAQTVFLVLGDILYRKANLEFAAASVENMMMSGQLLLLLSILVVAVSLPNASLWAVHPASLALVGAYLYSLKLLRDTHEKPMWLPRMTRGTVRELAGNRLRRSRADRTLLVLDFALCAAMVALSGWIIASSGMAIVERTGLSAGIMGGIFIAVTTSLPELVVAVTAIRLGALTLAVGDIVGGNAFDTLFVAISDVFYRDGSIYLAIGVTEQVWLASALLMSALLLLGFVVRERKGIGNIGFESALILLVYFGTVAWLAFGADSPSVAPSFEKFSSLSLSLRE